MCIERNTWHVALLFAYIRWDALTFRTVCKMGLKRERTYLSPSSDFDSFFFKSLSFGPCAVHTLSEIRSKKTKIDRLWQYGQMHQTIDSIHLGHRKPSMLIQSSSIFVRNTFPVLHIKGYYADFVLVAKVIKQLGLNINTISWLYNSHDVPVI